MDKDCARAVIIGCANEDVRVSVSVYIPGQRYGVAEMGLHLIALGDPVRRALGETTGPTVVDKGRPFIHLTTVIPGGTDDEIVAFERDRDFGRYVLSPGVAVSPPQPGD